MLDFDSCTMPDNLGEFLNMQMENMRLMNQQLQEMQTEIRRLSTNTPNNGFQLSNIPWPKPLLVEEGDLGECFNLFKSNWETYVKATGMNEWPKEKEPQKVNILLSVVGDAANLKYNNFGLTDQDKVSTENILSIIEKKIIIKKHPMYERYQFHICNQLENETFDTYVLRLTKILDACQFDKITPDKIKDIMLRDRIAFGIYDQSLKKKFLKEDPNKLTLDEVIDSCKVSEVTEDRLKSLKEEKTVNKVFDSEHKSHSSDWL